MENGKRHSGLCPGCRRLISIDEPQCPYCGLRNPGSRWKNIRWSGRLLSSDNLITNIICVNAALFILSIIISGTSTQLSANPLSFLSPGSNSLLLLGATGTIPIDQYHRWWTVISATYLHGSILHILFNMMALRQIGPLIIQEYGGYRMFAIYTIGGIGGFLVSYFAGVSFTIGASAAVCGLIGAAIFYGKHRGGAFGQAVYQQVGGWAIGIFAFGFLVPGINNWAHGGGLVCGILSGFLLGYHERNAETYSHKLLALVCVVATIGAIVWSVVEPFLFSS
jgi:rhomboid protease GluP